MIDLTLLECRRSAHEVYAATIVVGVVTFDDAVGHRGVAGNAVDSASEIRCSVVDDPAVGDRRTARDAPDATARGSRSSGDGKALDGSFGVLPAGEVDHGTQILPVQDGGIGAISDD